MVRELQDGWCMCITPDGPRGPLYKCRPGAVRLASMSGYPIIPACISYSSNNVTKQNQKASVAL
jgi:lysophospholipid acyltransferase (LPLAT)-like uncharacterized protein